MDIVNNSEKTIQHLAIFIFTNLFLIYIELDPHVNVLGLTFFVLFLFLVYGIIIGKLYPRISTDPDAKTNKSHLWKVKNCVEIDTFKVYYKRIMTNYVKLKYNV